MNKIISLFSMFFFLLALNVTAQDLPRPSPNASVTQTVGLTDITIEYSSPGVKDRDIWGGLVPYGELWRTGANDATTISFSRDVTLEGNEVPAGTYSLFTIPGEDEWTVILNENTNLSGTRGYDKGQDLMRFTVEPEEAPFRERLAFFVTDFTDEEATINMEWEELRLPISVGLGTDEQALTSISQTLGGTWRTYANAARYHLDNNKDLDRGLEYINTSLNLSNEWYNNWIKAQLLKARGQNKEALKFARKAKELGDKDANFFYRNQVEQALKNW